MAKNVKKPAQLDPRGAEGVPLDAPDNTGPAIAPEAVSRMHRSEDDRQAFEQSPEFNDQRNESIEDRREQERWLPGSPGSGRPDDASRGLDSRETKRHTPNPDHVANEDSRTRGRNEGELHRQPSSTSEARQPGPTDAAEQPTQASDTKHTKDTKDTKDF